VERADSTFVNDRYDEETYDDRDGTALGRIHITRRFEGDLEGVAAAELLTARTESGRDLGRGAEIDGTVVPDSGAGELEGLRGEATIAVDEDGTHRLSLEYELGIR